MNLLQQKPIDHYMTIKVLHNVKNVWHGAKNVRHGAKNVRHGAENVRHCAKKVWNSAENVWYSAENLWHVNTINFKKVERPRGGKGSDKVDKVLCFSVFLMHIY